MTAAINLSVQTTTAETEYLLSSSNDWGTSDTAEVAGVLSWLADAFGAYAVVLTEQSEMKDDVEILGAGRSGPFDRASVLKWSAAGLLAHPFTELDQNLWRQGIVDNKIVDAFIMPVRRVPGHNRLFLSAVFELPSSETRKLAEETYRRRTPIASGYFHLWQLHRLEQQKRSAFEMALDASAIGIVFLDARASVLFANQAAQLLLGAGREIKLQAGKVRAATRADGLRLSVALEQAVMPDETGGTASEGIMIGINRQDTAPLILLAVSHPRSGGEPQNVAAILYIVDPTMDATKMLAPVCKLYGMSKSEAGLACLLASGSTVAEAARDLNVKEQTARSVLKQLFIKTETRRQTELVRLLLSSGVKLTHAFHSKVMP